MATYGSVEVMIGGKRLMGGSWVEVEQRDRARMSEIHGTPPPVTATVSAPMDPAFAASIFGMFDREAWSSRILASIPVPRRITAAEIRARLGRSMQEPKVPLP